MKVKELISLLEEFEPELEVHFAHSAGDYWHNTVAPVVDTAEEGTVKWSEYHGMDKVVEPDFDSTDETEERKEVLLLS